MGRQGVGSSSCPPDLHAQKMSVYLVAQGYSGRGCICFIQVEYIALTQRFAKAFQNPHVFETLIADTTSTL